MNNNNDNVCSCVKKVKEIDVWGTRYLRDPREYGIKNREPGVPYLDIRLLFTPRFDRGEDYFPVGGKIPDSEWGDAKEIMRGDETAKIIYEDGSERLTTARVAWAELLISMDCEYE